MRLWIALILLPVSAWAADATGDVQRELEAQRRLENSTWAAALFLESKALDQQAKVCGSRIEGFAAQFDPAFAKWRERNASVLMDGEAFLRAAAVSEGKNFDIETAKLVGQSTKMLEHASPALFAENCEALQWWVSQPPPASQ